MDTEMPTIEEASHNQESDNSSRSSMARNTCEFCRTPLDDEGAHALFDFSTEGQENDRKCSHSIGQSCVVNGKCPIC